MRARSTVLVALTLTLTAAGWVATAAGAAAAKKPKLHCTQGAAAIKEIGPLFDIEANSANSLNKQASVVQFGNRKNIKKQIGAIGASSPLKTVRAQPAANVTFPDKNSAIADLNITIDAARTQVIHQGPQFYECVGKDQNGTKKGAWRITLYSLCNLAALAPCPPDMVTLALNALTPALKAQTTK
jgi:hypothetical protein